MGKPILVTEEKGALLKALDDGYLVSPGTVRVFKDALTKKFNRNIVLWSIQVLLPYTYP